MADALEFEVETSDNIRFGAPVLLSIEAHDDHAVVEMRNYAAADVEASFTDGEMRQLRRFLDSAYPAAEDRRQGGGS